MKHVKRISLFFIYLLCPFAVGIIVGMNVVKTSDNGIKEETSAYEPTVIREYVPDNEVLNNNVENVLNEGYFIALLNDYVVVYHPDKTTIFLFTDIKSGELPENICYELEKGISVPDEGALYDFLENYTS